MPISPRCLNCAKLLRKKTNIVIVSDTKNGVNSNRAYSAHRIVRSDTPLINRADCQRHTNMKVVSVSYWPVASKKGRVVSSFGEWDGKSYLVVAGYFCTGTCAQVFGQVAAKAGFRRTIRN